MSDDAFEGGWKIVKGVVPEVEFDEKGMSNCHFPHSEDYTCPDCCNHHANAGINVCYNCGADWDKYPDLGYDPRAEGPQKDKKESKSDE